MRNWDDYVMIGDAPDVVEGDVVCSNAYCVSFSGAIPDEVSILPIGHGVPIPCDWAIVRKDLLSGIVIPEDHSAAMLRIAMHLASSGVYFNSLAFQEPKTSKVWNCELSRLGGEIPYRNSIWLKDKIVNDCQGDGFPSYCPSGKPFRPLVVSGNISWSTKAVFSGYVESFSKIGVNFATFEYDEFIKMFSEDISRKILLSEICNVENGFTHMIAIDGMSIPPYLLKSARNSGVKTVLVSTEDPHCIDVTRRLHPYYDYIFSNDRNVAEMFGVHYLPVAGDSRCKPSEKDIDVLFLGALYPNRCEFLEPIVERCLAEGFEVRVMGPVYKGTPGRALSGVVDDGIVDPSENLSWTARSKVCLNVFRDVNCDRTGKNSDFSIPGYSMSPRCYDIPLCDAVMITDHRPEAVDFFGDHCLYGDDPAQSVVDAVKNYEIKKDMRQVHMKNVLQGHMYAHRAICLLSSIGQGFVL